MTTVVVAGALANKHRHGGSVWVRMSWAERAALARLRRRASSSRSQRPTASTRPARRRRSRRRRTLATFRAATARSASRRGRAGLRGRRPRARDDSRRAACVARRGGGASSTSAATCAGASCTSRVPRAASSSTSTPATPSSGTRRACRRRRLGDHDCYFTVGAQRRRASRCPLPTGGSRWRPIRQPVVLERWPRRAGAGFTGFTTVAQLARRVRPPVWEGRRFGLKAHEFRTFVGLAGAGGLRVRDRARHPTRADGRRSRARSHGAAGTSSIPRDGGVDGFRTLRPAVGRRVLGRAGRLRRDGQRLVQRPHRPLPRQPAGRRWCRTPASPSTVRSAQGLLAFADLGRGASQARERSRGDYARTRPRRGRIAEAWFAPGPALAPLLEAIGVCAVRSAMAILVSGIDRRRAPAGRGHLGRPRSTCSGCGGSGTRCCSWSSSRVDRRAIPASARLLRSPLAAALRVR